MRMPILLLTGFAALAPAAAAAKPAGGSEAAATALAAERGRLIYAYDQAAWHGSDDLQAKLPDFAERVGGWIVDGPADSPQLVFFDKDEAEPSAVYVADFRGTRLAGSRVLGADEDRRLSPERKAMVAARRAAVEALAAGKAQGCKSAPFNSVVLPPAAAGGPTLVYILTPQTDPNAIPLGGHYRIEVGADGRAGKLRKFTNTCLEMPFRDGSGREPAALVVSHLLDPVPTEIHVFSSLATGLPLFVGIKGRVWEVNGASIRLVKR